MEVYHFDDISYQGPLLDVPNPPPGTPYQEIDDYWHRELLRMNGVAAEEPALVEALASPHATLRGAAAHTLGSLQACAAIAHLREKLADEHDLVGVEAAYALGRMAQADGRAALAGFLGHPLNAYLSPPLAAGYLARLGDPRGFAVITQCFDQQQGGSRMLACKQLLLFARFQGQPGPDGAPIDVLALFGRALADPDANFQWQALVQIRELPPEQARPLLEDYLAGGPEPQLRAAVEEALRSLRG
ncbi:MAG: hypothetical protein OHK0022_02850 [Roseiflexaceae bacterium]